MIVLIVVGLAIAGYAGHSSTDNNTTAGTNSMTVTATPAAPPKPSPSPSPPRVVSQYESIWKAQQPSIDSGYSFVKQICLDTPDQCREAMTLELGYIAEWQKDMVSVPVPAEWQKANGLLDKALADLQSGLQMAVSAFNSGSVAGGQRARPYLDTAEAELIQAFDAAPDSYKLAQ